jgi:hypothetical protein
MQTRQALGIGSGEFMATHLDSHRAMLEDAAQFLPYVERLGHLTKEYQAITAGGWAGGWASAGRCRVDCWQLAGLALAGRADMHACMHGSTSSS